MLEERMLIYMASAAMIGFAVGVFIARSIARRMVADAEAIGKAQGLSKALTICADVRMQHNTSDPALSEAMKRMDKLRSRHLEEWSHEIA